MVRQPSPAATRQEVPFGVDRMMVQVSPSPVVRTSTMPPELVTPTAIGASSENGATEHQLMAIFGWDSPKQAAL